MPHGLAQLGSACTVAVRGGGQVEGFAAALHAESGLFERLALVVLHQSALGQAN